MIAEDEDVESGRHSVYDATGAVSSSSRSRGRRCDLNDERVNLWDPERYNHGSSSSTSGASGDANANGNAYAKANSCVSNLSFFCLLGYQVFFGGFLTFTTTWRVTYHQACVNTFVAFGIAHVLLRFYLDPPKYFTKLNVCVLAVGLAGLAGMIVQGTYFGPKRVFTGYWYWGCECTGLCALQWVTPLSLLVGGGL